MTVIMIDGSEKRVFVKSAVKNKAKTMLRGFLVCIATQRDFIHRKRSFKINTLLPDVISTMCKGSKGSRQNLQERKKFTGLGFVCDLLPRLH